MKGQMTLTILVSLVVIALFAIAFYITGSVVENKIDTTQRRQEQGSEALKPVTDYVTQCLDEVGRQGIVLLTSQGGRIFQDQGGLSLPENTARTVGQARIAVGIAAPKGSLGNFFVVGDNVNYPWKEFPYLEKNGVQTEYYKGYYGINTLPSLERVKEELASYVEQSITNCLDWSVFAARNINVEADEPDVEVVTTQSDTRLVLNYELQISSTSELQATLEQFTVSYPVRLRSILNASHAFVNHDVSDVTFNLRTAKRGAIAVSVEDIGEGYDLITVNDGSSRLVNEIVPLQFLRENRQPALAYFNPQKEVCTGATVNYDATTSTIIVDSSICGKEEERIALRAFDPDEDELRYAAFRTSDQATLPYTIDRLADRFMVMGVSDGFLQDTQEVEFTFT